MTRKKYYYNFYDDNEESYGIVEVSESPGRFEKLVEEYKKTDEEEYNLDDLYQFLRERGYEVNPIEPVDIYF